MSANLVGVCYGLRYSLGLDIEVTDEILLPLEQGKDPRLVAARSVGLGTWFGRDKYRGQHFLYIGTFYGFFGAKKKSQLEVTDAAIQEIMRSTKEKLTQAGLVGTPSLHIQLWGGY